MPLVSRRVVLRASLSGSAALPLLALGGPSWAGEASESLPALEYGNPTFPLANAEFEQLEKVAVRGKVAVVTGASTGIGRAVAEDLAQRGFVVVGTSRRPHDYPPPSKFRLWQLDLTIPGSVHAFAERLRAKYREINLLVLNAGRWFIGRYSDSDMRKVRQLYDTNMNGHQALYRLLEPAFPTGADDYARVFFTSSITDKVYLFENPPLPGIPPGYSGELNYPYSVSKSGVARAGQLLYGRLRNSGSNVQVTVFYPGFFVNTNILANSIYGNDPDDPEIAFARETFRPLFAQGQDPRLDGLAFGQMAELESTFLTSFIVNKDAVPGSLEEYFQNRYWPSTLIKEEDRTVRSSR